MPRGTAVVDKMLTRRKVSDLELYLEQIREFSGITMERMAKFRNIIVHQYEGINSEIVIHILQERLVDFEGFRDKILAYLNRT